MFSFFYTSIKKALLCAVFVFVLSAAPFTAQAVIVGTIEGPGPLLTGVAAMAGATAISAEADASLTLKEFVLDALIPAIRQGITTTITQNIVTWINNGFDGGPGYVTNLGGFLGQVADNTALDFLQGTELGLLCSPFALEVRLALVLNYTSSFNRHISCSLGDVAGRFLSGDFINGGGWRSLFRLSTSFQNNPYSAYLQAQDQLNVRIASRTGEERQLLNYGGGFFSKGKCTNLPTAVSQPLGEVGEDAPPSAADVSQSRAGCESLGGSWQIVTPGSVINDNLSQSLGSGFRQLELADEMNEIIGALLAQVIQQTVTSIDGLSGLSGRNSSSAINGRSYFESIIDENTVSTFDATKQGLIANINASISTEGRYQAIINSIASGYQQAQDSFEEVNVCAGTKALSVLATSASTTAASIQPAIDDLTARSVAVDALIQQLNTLAEQAQDASLASELTAASRAYDVLQQSGTLHTANHITLIIKENSDIHQPAIAEYQIRASEDLALCGT